MPLHLLEPPSTTSRQVSRTLARVALLPQATTAKDPTFLLTLTMAKHNRAWFTANLEVLRSKSYTSKLRPRMTVSAHSCAPVLFALLAVGAAWNAAMVSAKRQDSLKMKF
ncbi:hypothetical protein RvY_12432-2 [Ramazzottius varieornatus]|uniref:Uncharacterized protein n=1 Tax=Ramazzottius varieornatus TaxID=947166 RepID=A0A1D1VLS4_RAMVA|nr:hypothetical protein RvY_12432-2 [Ramazzottius varieornatus]